MEHAPEACSWCASGSYLAATTALELQYPECEVDFFAFGEIPLWMERIVCTGIVAWNDDPLRKQADVVALVNRMYKKAGNINVLERTRT